MPGEAEAITQEAQNNAEEAGAKVDIDQSIADIGSELRSLFGDGSEETSSQDSTVENSQTEDAVEEPTTEVDTDTEPETGADDSQEIDSNLLDEILGGDVKESDPWPEDAPDWVKERVGRAKRKAEEAEAQAEQALKRAEELEQELQRARSQSVSATVDSPESVDKLEQDARSALELAQRWDRAARRDLDAAVEMIKKTTGHEVEDAYAYIDTVMDNANDALKTIPAKRQALQLRDQVEQQTASLFPWYSDTNSAYRKKVDAMLAQRPELKGIPEHSALVAFAVVGQALVEAKQKRSTSKTAKPSPAKPSPPSEPTGSSAAPSERPADNGLLSLKQKALSGSPDDMKAFLGQFTMKLTGK